MIGDKKADSNEGYTEMVEKKEGVRGAFERFLDSVEKNK
jgi:hypothetical protein